MSYSISLVCLKFQPPFWTFYSKASHRSPSRIVLSGLERLLTYNWPYGWIDVHSPLRRLNVPRLGLNSVSQTRYSRLLSWRGRLDRTTDIHLQGWCIDCATR